MEYKNKVTTRFCNSLLKSKPLQKYWDDNGGLLFTEFNTTFGLKGKLRALDAIRFPCLETGVYRAAGNYEAIANLIKNNEVELIEVHGWGFYGFGQIVGKSEIVQKYWEPKKVSKVLITFSPKYDSQRSLDLPTFEVFEKFGITVYSP